MQETTVDGGSTEWKLVHVTTGELLCGMILAQDVFSKNEMLLVTKGQEVSATILEHLRRWATNTGVVEPFTAWVPND